MNIIVISFCVYTAFIVLVGLWSARKARKSDVDYFLAGRNLNPWVAALSASASSESGWVTFGLVGLAYGSGIAGYWLIPGTIIGFLFNWLVIAGRMRARAGAIDALTLPDFFSKHFDEAKPVLRIIAVVVIAVAMTMYVAAQFAAAGKAFEQTFNVTYLAGVLIGTGIVLAYTVLGGFRAACWTDFLQAFIMVGALVVFPVYLIATTGGFDFVQN
ncbi:MAG: sodium/proline symporter, partial [Planctomycetota bacterium]